MFDTNLELDLQLEQMIEKNEGQWKCKVCGKTKKHKGHIKEHAETHISGGLHTCIICDKSGMNRKALKNHHYRLHKSGTRILFDS